jgi:DNA-binding response OmpR family regulator
MNVLIVEANQDLGRVWTRHLHRAGLNVTAVATEDAAVAHIGSQRSDVIILDLVLPGGSAISVADYARFRHPDTEVIFVTDTAFFSDGSIFGLLPNARAFVESHVQPGDLTAMVEHFGRAAGRLP